MRWFRGKFAFVIFAIAAVLFIVGFSLTGCTVSRPAIDTTLPSFDGSAMNSGMVGWHTNGETIQLIVTPHWRERYTNLVANFGGRFHPPLVDPQRGLTPFTNGTWLVDDEHLSKFNTMNRWRRERPPL
jgi:hypothetical protein